MSLILTLAMLITALPFGVFAEEEQQVQTPAAVVETVEVPAAEQPKAEEPEAPAQPAAQEPEAPQQPAEQEPEVPAQPAEQEPEVPAQPAEQEPEAPVQPAVKEQLTEQPAEEIKVEEKEKPQVVKYTVSFSDGFGWSFSMEVEEGKEISKLPPAPKAEGYEFVRFYREVKQLAEDGVTEEIVRKTVSASTVVTEPIKVKVEYKKIEEPE